MRSMASYGIQHVFFAACEEDSMNDIAWCEGTVLSTACADIITMFTCVSEGTPSVVRHQTDAQVTEIILRLKRGFDHVGTKNNF